MFKTPLAWLNLTHEKTKLVVAIAGVAFAVLLIFMNLGFLGALATTASQTYSSMNADIFLVSPLTLELSTTKPFPVERIYQAAGLKGVDRVMPLFVGYMQWRNPETRINRAIFAYGFNPNDPVFLMPELKSIAGREKLRAFNTAFIDRRSRPEFGPLAIGTTTETERRDVTVVGQYDLGGGFAADGTVIMSDVNFQRYLDRRGPAEIDLGLIQLSPDADPEIIAAKLREMLPADVDIFTKPGIIEHDRRYWIDTTSTGFIFGMGVVVAFIVGTVIVYQILYTDINDHMAEYATLKAMGYGPFYLCSVVLQEALILAVIGYIPGLVITMLLYELTLNATAGTLPVSMNLERAISVFILALIMCSASGLISIQRVLQSDPAEVF
ncbi:DevC protein [Thalassoporum mexicanum PCC 7367]|uniref:ABC transporter permease DevC n=1 Tax=Thalassoporum mexicanum TaxID=3457544 RepID=UPI00029FBE13|nr:ABC transporter permease DevC [Pseudanabaena sp. PCC 7367]AFY71534.1 DevC protein [Pseudanabaena sp. PCC 7367]